MNSKSFPGIGRDSIFVRLSPSEENFASVSARAPGVWPSASITEVFDAPGKIMSSLVMQMKRV